MPVIKFIKKLTNRLQDFFAAAAFAEEGETENARMFVREQDERLPERALTLRHEIRNSDRISAG